MSAPKITFINLTTEQVTKLENGRALDLQYSRHDSLTLAMDDCKNVRNGSDFTVSINPNDLYQLKRHKVLAKQSFVFFYNDNPSMKTVQIDHRQEVMDMLKDKKLEVLCDIIKFIKSVVVQTGEDCDFSQENPTTTADALEQIKKNFKFLGNSDILAKDKERFVEFVISEVKISVEAANIIADILVNNK
jgi:hypothetical protein